MSNQYIGEIRVFGGSFAIQSWAFCQGQTLPISQYAALFQLIGTTYGGNGQTTFQLPNLIGNVAVQFVYETAGPTSTSYTGRLNMGTSYTTTAPNAQMSGSTFGMSAGGNQPHENTMPILAMNYIIALEGIFPTQ